MDVPGKTLALEHAVERLGELLGQRPNLVTYDRSVPGVDALVQADSRSFLMAWRASSSPGKLLSAIDQLKQAATASNGDAIPLLVVPYMGKMGRQQCEEAGVAWLDLSGNASIQAPGLRIVVSGQPNLFKRRGRPATPFAPKSARIARWLLMHPGEHFTQQQLARATNMDKGFTSRIIARLEQDHLVVRDERGAVFAPDPDRLLDAWAEDYDFTKHRILRGHVPARSGEELLHRLCDELVAKSVDHAATGLAAAWQMTRFAAFRIVTICLCDDPAPVLLKSLSFREDERGANLWLVVPRDEGVFQGAGYHDGVRCVHPAQVYLDLKAHPERAAEAADHLRAELLRWRMDA